MKRSTAALVSVMVASFYGNIGIVNAFISEVRLGISRRVFCNDCNRKMSRFPYPLHMTSIAPYPIESAYSTSYDDFAGHQIEIQTSLARSPSRRSIKTELLNDTVGKEIGLSGEVEGLEVHKSSSSGIKISPVKASRGTKRRIKGTPRMIKVNKNESASLLQSSVANGPNKRRKSSTQLLTREEEKRLTYAIRALRRVTQIRDELAVSGRDNEDESSFYKVNKIGYDFSYRPFDEEWAKACGLSVQDLHRVVSLGQEARAQLVAKNEGLVVQIAKRYNKRGTGSILTHQDMIQEGNLGLMEAAERFDPSRGFKFSTYAAWWIRQRILRSIADHSRVIRLPVHVHTMLGTIDKAKKEMTEEIGRVPSIPELAHRLDMPVQKLKQYTDASRNVLSLEGPISTNGRLDDKRVIGDGIASDSPTPEHHAEVNFLKQDIRAVVDELSAKERDVLVLRFGLDDGDPKTIDEVASKLKISRERVRLFEARAINKLRHPGRNYKLKEYVDNIEEPATTEQTPEEIWSF